MTGGTIQKYLDEIPTLTINKEAYEKCSDLDDVYTDLVNELTPTKTGMEIFEPISHEAFVIDQKYNTSRYANG